jgi:tRNA dimethylallyltransferase
MGKPPLLVIAGPTASGKSALALERAQSEGGVVINADASQLYADIPILSAQPGPAERARAPHRLYGVLDGGEIASAARWAAMARTAIAQVQAEGRLPILVGGTGLYLSTLVEGIAPVPPIAEAVRTAVRTMGAQAVRAALEREDPAMAARLHPNDPQRNARALEVLRATGQSLGQWHRMRTGGVGEDMAIEVVLLLVKKEALDARIGARFRAMLDAGAVEEVRRLVARGLPPDRPVMKALGVQPLLRHLAGDLSLEEAMAEACRQTRAYARRQRTWFESGGRSRGWLADANRLQLS